MQSQQPETLYLQEVGELHQKLVDDKQYAVITDNNGNFQTFLGYRNVSTSFEFDVQVKAIKNGIITEEQAIEKLRAQIVQSMRHGKLLFIDVGKESPELLFKEFGDADWPAAKVFNHEEWTKDEVHKLILKEGEHHD